VVERTTPARARRGALAQVASLATGRTLAAAVSAAWFVVAARQLPVPTLGDLALLLSLGSIFTALADGGYSVVLAHEIAARPQAAWSALRLTVLIRIGLAVLAVLAIGAAYLVSAQDRDAGVIALYGISVLSTVVYSSVAVVLRADGRANIEGANEVISRVFVFAIGWWLLSRGGGLRAAVGVYAVADLTSAVVLGIYSRRYRSRSSPASAQAFRLRAAAPLALSTILEAVYYRIDVWLLALIAGASSVAHYAAGYRLFDGVLLPATAVAALTVPTIAASARTRAGELTRLVRLALIIAIPAAVALFVGASPIMRVVYGEAYASASGILRLLALAVVPSAVALVLVQGVALFDRGYVVRVTVGVLILNVALNVLTIPAWGGKGSAIATLVCQVVLALALLARSRRAANERKD
jgi:O-antigen/teichoic acid export membrane protein